MRLDDALVDAMINAIPHWFEASESRHPFTLEFGAAKKEFHTFVPLNPDERALIQTAENLSERILGDSDRGRDYTPGEVELFTRGLALHWLENRDPSVRWDKLFVYAEQLRYRTYENDPVTINAVINPTLGPGTKDITDQEGETQKILDPLATSPYTYLVIDEEIRFVGYEDVLWSRVRNRSKYNRCPEFLTPIAQGLIPGMYSFHRTRMGDILILDHTGLLAVWRKGSWYIYDTPAIVEAIAEALRVGSGARRRIADYLFDLVLDLSYKRHGALLVYDPDGVVFKEGVDAESAGVFATGKKKTVGHDALTAALRSVQMQEPDPEKRKKRIVAEAASMDGATVFDDEGFKACGVMVKTHDNVEAGAGARTTAALSARLYKVTPIKVSADGEITILFEAQDQSGDTVSAEMHFA